MPQPVEIVRDYLKKRRQYTEPREIARVSQVLFALAIRDKEAAEELLREDNRFLKVIPQVISEEQLIKFARINGKELVDKLIDYARIDSNIADKMRKEVGDREPTPNSVVRQILAKREKINTREAIEATSALLFDLAIRDKQAAEDLLAEDNRFLKVIPKVVPEDKLLKFSRVNSKELVEKLIHFANIDSSLARKMRKEVVDDPKEAALRHALLRHITPHKPAPLADDGRTRLAVKYNAQLIKKDNNYGVMLGREFIPMITRNTRDFNKKLCSVGSSSSREVILLDPEDQVLKQLYERLKKQLPNTTDPAAILEAVKDLTKICFPDNKPEHFINQNLRQGKQIIPLSEFILQGQGVCRHHTLLNAYFLSRLVQDNLLKGEVIHHRQDFGHDGAHTWNVFRATNGTVYSLDSLWNDVTNITDYPGAINRLYRHNVEAKIKEMHFSEIPAQEKRPKADIRPDFNHMKQRLDLIRRSPELPNSPGNIDQFNALKEPQYSKPLSAAEKIDVIKSQIEKNKFIVGDYILWKGGRMLNLDNGEEKRVPHRVYEIYEAIKRGGDYANDPGKADGLWQVIQKHAGNALRSPRPHQHPKTTSFYTTIAHDTVSKNNDLFTESEIGNEHSFRGS
ncbi:hypothetical protein [Legionella cardiaca]|uniref:Dot/Icm T4SS effector n=1 Tax=Legionella cardiaca TaxID=1071983 RepID=A0ABY8AN84_9GAMM|nr:hypothetical protein [Legionella cardiaca]WED42023.1 hypothetical protein PXX05_08765 [Legionella cardiaca]